VKYFTVAAICIAAGIIFPLSLVWKQVYITTTSMQQDSLQDSLTVLQKEVITLTILAERLSSTERIEMIAKGSLALDYPSSREIVVVRPRKKKESGLTFSSPFWTVFKKSLTPEKG
jgi:cell division protein FtsL